MLTRRLETHWKRQGIDLAGEQLVKYLNETGDPRVVETIADVRRMKPGEDAENRIRAGMMRLADWSPPQHALLRLYVLYAAGSFGLLRRCRRQACRKHFMASRPKQTFCSKDCQERFWTEYRTQTEAGRKEQAVRMADWRAKQRRTKTKRRKRT